MCYYLRHSSHCTKMVIIHSAALHMKCRGVIFVTHFTIVTTVADVVNCQNAYACAMVMGSVTVFAAVDCIA